MFPAVMNTYHVSNTTLVPDAEHCISAQKHQSNQKILLNFLPSDHIIQRCAGFGTSHCCYYRHQTRITNQYVTNYNQVQLQHRNSLIHINYLTTNLLHMDDASAGGKSNHYVSTMK